PPDLSLEATGPGGASTTFVATATDPDDSAGPVTCQPRSGSTFPLGTTTVSCASTDTHGNTGTAEFHVNVQDTTPPTTPTGLTIVDGSQQSQVSLSWTASTDAVGVTGYDLSVDGVQVASVPPDAVSA